MTDYEYAKKVRKLLDEVLTQIGRLSIDIGLINDIGIETNKRLKEEAE